MRIIALEAGVERQRWRPFTVIEQATMSRFTDDGAWELIADYLAGAGPVEYKPPSHEFPDHAYAIIETRSARHDVYAKIALSMKFKKVVGISFHYADF